MTVRRVLVDTGAWLAAFHRRDQYHALASAELRRLRRERARLLVTELILAELHVHLLHGLGAARAIDHLTTVESDPLVEEVFADQALQESAMNEWMRRFADQPLTFTDAVSFALMRSRGVGAAFSFDRHFAVAGFEMLPGAGGKRGPRGGRSRSRS